MRTSFTSNHSLIARMIGATMVLLVCANSFGQYERIGFQNVGSNAVQMISIISYYPGARPYTNGTAYIGVIAPGYTSTDQRPFGLPSAGYVTMTWSAYGATSPVYSASAPYQINDTFTIISGEAYGPPQLPTDDNDNGKDCDKSCPSCNGMPVWNVSEPYISLWLHDEPLSYQPVLGARIALDLAYKQREFSAGLNTNIFSTGKKWNFSWFSYVAQDGGGNNILHFPDGRKITFCNGSTNDYFTSARLSGDTTI